MLYNLEENMEEDTNTRKKYLLSFQNSLLTQVKRFTIKSILESLSWVSMGAWHPHNFWTEMSGNRWFWQFYYIMLCCTLEFWRFTSDWHPLFQIPNSSSDTQSRCIEVTQGDIFMEQKMRFGPVGNNEKKVLGRLWATFEGGCFMFSWAKKVA